MLYFLSEDCTYGWKGGVELIAKNSGRYFFDDKPLFGMDIGHDTLRVLEFDMGRKVPRLKGYGSIAFPPESIVDGVVVKPELIAHAALQLFHKELVGEITTNRVAVSLPAGHAFSRAIQLPEMNPKDMDEAVRTEMEQYIPIANEELCLDYLVLRSHEDGIEVFAVAVPRKIVDSYLILARMMGLEAVLFDTAIGASAQLFARDRQSDVPSVLIDFGSETTDLTVFNHGLIVTGTVAFGGDAFTAAIGKALRITPHEAIVVKSKYGLTQSVVQKQIVKALEPSLETLMKEIRRTVRYYEQRYAKEAPINQVVIMGGGANMPGLAEYLTEKLRLPTRTFDPAMHIDFGHLRPFYNAERMSYVTAAGLAVIDPREVFA